MQNLILRNVSLLTYIFLVFYFFSNWSTQLTSKRQARKLVWVCMVCLVILCSIFSDLLLGGVEIPYVNLCLSILLIYSIAKIRDISTLEALIWSIILIVTNLICEILSFTIAQSIMHTKMMTYRDPLFAIIAISVTTLLEWIAIVILKQLIIKGQSSKLSLNLTSFFFLISVPILSIIILFSLLMRTDATGNQGIIEVSITSSVIILNSCVLLLYKITITHQNDLHQLTLSKNALDAEHRLLEEMKKNRATVLKLKHDLKNQYLVVLGLLDNAELAEAREYIQTSLQILEPPTKLYASDSVLNYLLNDKLNYALNHGISVDHQLFISKNIKIDNDVLAIVIGNIIDNAIQASLRMQTDNKKITVLIKQYNDDLIVEVSNTFDSNERETRSTRKEKGLGMKNIDALIKEIGGIYKHWHEEDIYFVTVVLFNVYRK